MSNRDALQVFSNDANYTTVTRVKTAIARGSLLLMIACVPLAGCSSADAEDSDGESESEPAADEAALVLRGYDEPSDDDKDAAATRYSNVDPNHVIPQGLLRNALGFVEANKDKLDNTRYLGVIDFSKHSGKRRFFIVNLSTGAVAPHVVAHGSGSDPSFTGYAQSFSNTSGTNKTSLGYYVTGETFWMANHGTALRLDGVSDTNSRARARGIVLHGASYVDDGRSPQGRSWGCPAVPNDEKADIIAKLKSGALIYAERSSVVQ
jgi:hypothetical protein